MESTAPPSPDVALLHAADRGDVAGVLSAVKSGANVDARDGCQRTALFLASQQGHSEVVESLVDLGADSNAQADDGSTPLMHAALHGVWSADAAALRVLLGAEADVNVRTNTGGTALSIVHRSTQNCPQKDRVVQILKNAGAVRT